MLYLLHTHWLWFFGAVAVGVIVGWLTYLRAATAWTDRPVHIAIGVVALGAVVAIAKVVPGRYGYWLELGVMFTVFYAAGCFIGWALRDLAEYMPAAAKPGTTAGSYLFRDAHVGLATGDAYMRTAPSDGSLARTRLPMPAASDGFDKAPVPGGYTFPTTRRFADATTSRPATGPAPGLRRHWSWPQAEGAAPYVPTEFTGSKGGYVFPTAAPDAPHANISREGATAGGHYKHWSWRAAGPVETLAASTLAAKPTTAAVSGASSAAATGASGIAGRAAKPEFTGSKGGYVFPAVAAAAPPLAARDGKTRSGLYRHWSWRGTDSDAVPAATPADVVTAHGAATSPGAVVRPLSAPVAPGSIETPRPSSAAAGIAPPAAEAAPASATPGLSAEPPVSVARQPASPVVGAQGAAPATTATPICLPPARPARRRRVERQRGDGDVQPSNGNGRECANRDREQTSAGRASGKRRSAPGRAGLVRHDRFARLRRSRASCPSARSRRPHRVRSGPSGRDQRRGGCAVAGDGACDTCRGGERRSAGERSRRSGGYRHGRDR